MTNHTDDYYIEQVLGGNVNAFAALVERYKNMIFTLAVKMLKDREEAEEIAQDVFVKCYQSLSRFEGKAKFSTWLYKIAYNGCIDVLKKRQKYMMTEAVSLINNTPVKEEENVLSHLMRNDRNEIINEAIGKLPGADQAVVLMYYFEDLSLKEIAKIVNLNANTIKIRLHRSREKLYKLLEHNTLIRD